MWTENKLVKLPPAPYPLEQWTKQMKNILLLTQEVNLIVK